MATTQHESLWISTTPLPTYRKLDRDLRTDVVVIGAGMVGVLTASLLARAGRDVVLLDARRALQGVTGYTTAKISASHGPIYDHIRSNFGSDSAKLYAQSNSRAIDWIEDQARERQIECDFRRRDLYLYAEDQKAVETIEKEATAAAGSGLNCNLVQQVDLPFQTFGAVRFRDQAEFHPLKFLRRFLLDLGENVYEHTAVKDVDEGSPTTVTTREGHKIVAEHVVIATHFPFFDPAFYYARLNPFRDYAIAADVESPRPEGMYVGSGEGYTYRWQPSDQGELLVVSGGTHKVGKVNNTQEYYDKIEQHTREHFKTREIPFRWATQDNETIDKVPYVGRISARAERVFVACGFEGWGMTNSVVSSQLLFDLIQGNQNPLEELYSPLRFKPVTGAGTLMEIGKDSVQHLIGERLRSSDQRTAAQLAPGEGEVLQTDDGKVAVYKDEDGQIHAVSPVCTHMGCILEWNNGEKSWDCPCHGSRFSYEGKVLQGPAVEDLEPK